MEDNKIMNTLVMMGVKPVLAMFAQDAIRSMRNIVSKEAESYYRNTVLNTVVMDKTFRQWYAQFQNEAIKRELVFKMSNGEPSSFQPKDFNIDEAGVSHLNALISLVLQEYYKKEYSL